MSKKVLVMTLGILLSVSYAQASISIVVSGNTYPQSTSSIVDGHVNFMVVDLIGATTGELNALSTKFVAASGSPGFDTSASYLYLFQTVNDGTNTLGISQNTVGVDPSQVTSYGGFKLGFTQGGILTAAGGPYLGGTSAAPGDPSGEITGAGGGYAANPAAVGPSGLVLNASSLSANYNNSLAAGKVSNIWGYTSDVAPTQWTSTGIQDGGTNDQGTVPSNSRVPEPATLVVWSVLGAGAAGIAVLRRRRNGARWSKENRRAIQSLVEGKLYS